MSHLPSYQRIVQQALYLLLAVLALNAFAGGYYGISGAKQVPEGWLEGSPFRSYWIPSLILVIAVGGSALLAAIAVFKNRRYARLASVGAALVLLGWILAQVAIIGFVSWLQPAMAILGIVLLLLTWQYHPYES